MCVSPTLIPNPNYGSSGKFAAFKDCVSRYIPVPCGHCKECISLRSNGIVQRAELEELAGWPFFSMLSYNDASMPWLTCSDGVSIRYADISDVQNMIKRLRKSNAFGRRFRYFGVSELGEKKARPHFHILWFFERFPEDNVYTPLTLQERYFPIILNEWRRNYARRLTKKGNIVPDSRHPDYRPLCTYVRKFIFGKWHYNYDFHYVQPSTLNGTTQDVSFYVTKYLFKDSKQKDNLKFALKRNLDPDEFYDTWSKVRPRSFSSLNFGFGIYDDINPRKTSKEDRLSRLASLPSSAIVRKSVARSRLTCDKPKFFDVQTGKPLPLSRYWYRFGDLYSVDDYVHFWMKNPDGRVDNVILDDRSISEKLLAEQSLDRITEHDAQLNLDLLYE